MYTLFIYNNGANPFIAKTSGELFKMLKKYDVENIGENTYTIHGERKTPPRSYNEIK